MTNLETKATLWYAHDPMCSYCYAFVSVWQKVQETLPDAVQIKYVLGGLAPDSDEAMDAKMVGYLQATWNNITEAYGVTFNHDYWDNAIPRRSTYPSCRAVVVAKQHALEKEMIAGIQKAYYQQAKNPSDIDTLVGVAESLGLNGGKFATDLVSDETEKLLQYDLEQARIFGLDSFPSLLLIHAGTATKIPVNYLEAEPILKMIDAVLAA